jgi:hypothetical protein
MVLTPFESYLELEEGQDRLWRLSSANLLAGSRHFAIWDVTYQENGHVFVAKIADETLEQFEALPTDLII